MSIEKQPRNSTEAQQFLFSYPIPAPIRLPPARDLIRAELPENDTEKIQEICLSVHITVAIGKRRFHAENEQKAETGMGILSQSPRPHYIQRPLSEMCPWL